MLGSLDIFKQTKNSRNVAVMTSYLYHERSPANHCNKTFFGGGKKLKDPKLSAQIVQGLIFVFIF